MDSVDALARCDDQIYAHLFLQFTVKIHHVDYSRANLIIANQIYGFIPWNRGYRFKVFIWSNHRYFHQYNKSILFIKRVVIPFHFPFHFKLFSVVWVPHKDYKASTHTNTRPNIRHTDMRLTHLFVWNKK